MSYDPQLVVLSYLIAALAGYVTLELAGRVRANVAESARFPWGWAAFGAFTMGTGIWSMHFVGMSAMQMELSYDIGLTLVSWAAALAAAGLALWIVGSGRLSVTWIAAAAVAMGIAISAMHYIGMFAIRFSTPLGFDAPLFLVSVLIAVGASAAALWIAGQMRIASEWRDVFLRVGAALVMGLAVAGMHYTGMAATDIAAGAMPNPENGLRGENMVALTTLGTVLLLLLGLSLSVANAREIATNRKRKLAAERRVRSLAFFDRHTGLPNRARFTQMLTEMMNPAEQGRSVFTVGTLRVVGANGAPVQELPNRAAAFIARELKHRFGVESCGRPSADLFAVLFDRASRQSVESGHAQAVDMMKERFAKKFGMQLHAGFAEYPADGETGQMLLFRANGRASDPEGRGVREGVQVKAKLSPEREALASLDSLTKAV